MMVEITVARDPARKVAETDESIALMEPMLPPEGRHELDDLAFDLAQRASRLAGQLHPVVRRGVSDLVRSMNCYYSNLIEGHNTHPRDIDRALAGDYSNDPAKRELQLEATAHIAVQQYIDSGADAEFENIVSRNYLKKLHYEFCSRLPDEFLWVTNPDTGEHLRVEPGTIRTRDVAVGRHVPPGAATLHGYLTRFEEAYDPGRLSRPRQLVAIAASHHRLLWIHPFLEGNGRVARLFAHAWLIRLGIGDSLWSVSRGLARTHQQYKQLLMNADAPREGDLDGRGSLSEKALVEFCTYFIETCIDQVSFMEELLAPHTFLNRLEAWVEQETRVGHLPRGSYRLLREAYIAGEFGRGRVEDLTGYRDRKARDVLYRLLEKRLLVSDSPRGKVRLNFPSEAAEQWFPRLYPSDIG